MLTMKALMVAPSSKSTSHRRTKGTRRAPPPRRSSVGGAIAGIVAFPFAGWAKAGPAPGRSADHQAVGPGPPGHLLAIQVFEERNDELAAETGHLLEASHVEAGASRPARAPLGLEPLQVFPVDERALPNAVEHVIRQQHPRDPLEELRVLAGPGRQLAGVDPGQPGGERRLSEAAARTFLARAQAHRLAETRDPVPEEAHRSRRL